MKKSEAVKLIEKVIYDTYDYDPDLGWTVDAEAVLDALLEEGMGIPPVVRRLTVDEMDELGANNIGFYTGYEHVYEWEPEE